MTTKPRPAPVHWHAIAGHYLALDRNLVFTWSTYRCECTEPETASPETLKWPSLDLAVSAAKDRSDVCRRWLARRLRPEFVSVNAEGRPDGA